MKKEITVTIREAEPEEHWSELCEVKGSDGMSMLEVAEQLSWAAANIVAQIAHYDEGVQENAL